MCQNWQRLVIFSPFEAMKKILSGDVFWVPGSETGTHCAPVSEPGTYATSAKKLCADSDGNGCASDLSQLFFHRFLLGMR